jgi:hypothetical protein
MNQCIQVADGLSVPLNPRLTLVTTGQTSDCSPLLVERLDFGCGSMQGELSLHETRFGDNAGFLNGGQSPLVHCFIRAGTRFGPSSRVGECVERRKERVRIEQANRFTSRQHQKTYPMFRLSGQHT